MLILHSGSLELSSAVSGVKTPQGHTETQTNHPDADRWVNQPNVDVFGLPREKPKSISFKVMVNRWSGNGVKRFIYFNSQEFWSGNGVKVNPLVLKTKEDQNCLAWKQTSTECSTPAGWHFSIGRTKNTTEGFSRWRTGHYSPPSRWRQRVFPISYSLPKWKSLIFQMISRGSLPDRYIDKKKIQRT